MRIAVYPADLGGCGHYRLIWPAKALIDQGVDGIELVKPDPDGNPSETWTCWVADDHHGVPHLRDIVNPPDVDVVVLQRPLQLLLAEAVPILQAKGIAVVVEVDDDFSAMSPANAAYWSAHPSNPVRNWRHLEQACGQADLVTVSTPALAKRYGAHGRIVIVPNLVPSAYLDEPRYRGPLAVGWSGSTETHPFDLQETRGGIAQACVETGAEMRVVGTGKGVMRNLGFPSEVKGAACGWRPLADYPAMMAQATVGIVPLELSGFNEAKSWLKGLEYAALGVPFVASPTQQYRELHSHGVGVLARKGNSWRAAVRDLLADNESREGLAERQRMIVAHRFVLEDRAERWLDAWRSAADRKVAA